MNQPPDAPSDAASPAPGAVAAQPAMPMGPAGKFTEGSTIRHVLVMTATGSVGLMAIFIVDFLNLFYISLLGQQELAAAIGYVSTLLFFLTSLNIGLSIGVTALVSRALGARDRDRARQLAASGLALVIAVNFASTIAGMLASDTLLTLIGASGRTHDLAERFLLITFPSTFLFGGGMAMSGLLRSVGDAQRAMWVTLGGGLATAFADPLFIFGFGLGLDGAAIATILSRVVFAGIGWHGAVIVHNLVARPNPATLIPDIRAIGAIAVPAILTNVATPIANAYATSALAGFSDAAVAAGAVINRLVPVAFGAIFALTGSVGPIIGQNLGARRFDRVRGVVTDSLMLVVSYVLALWLVLFIAQDQVAAMFSASGEAGLLIRFYCTYVAGTFVFMGALFVANTAFNTMGAPLLATAFNWGRATLGTIPFTIIGAKLGGAQGVLLGSSLGAVLLGVGAVLMAYRVIGRLDKTA